MPTLYLDFLLTNGSRICVQRHDDLQTMPNILPDGSMPNHDHEFYEMVLIVKNSCRHIYYDDETTLLPGDFFLIPPHRPHAYYFNEEILYYNCQFYIDAIASEWVEDVQALCYDRLRNVNIPRNYSELNDINRQGILHLNPEDTAVTASFFDRILDEQISTRSDSERMKRLLLHLVLSGINRIREKRILKLNQADHWKQKMIRETLSCFEKNINTNWETDTLAAQYHISESYFRSIFRDITGMSPKQFLNQLRINRAVDMIQHQGKSINDASSAVGIYDLNYFSRLCKNITGYPPSHFRKKMHTAAN